MWLTEHEHKLRTGENVIDDSSGMNAPVSKRLFAGEKCIVLRRPNRTNQDSRKDDSFPLHKVKARVHSEKKNVKILQEKAEVIQVGFTEKNGRSGKEIEGSESEEV